MNLRFNVRARTDRVVVDVAGEIDTETALDLQDFLLTVVEQRGPRLVVKLSQVTFMDFTGIAALLHVRTATRFRGGDLAIIAPSRPIQLLLRAACVDQVFTLLPSGRGAIPAG
ncbi:hypothetical protein Psi01_36850 [Planobispora siamensis]|uniref:Anti-sigma factor antagonist n=1 Tax=Planobispora siamensis TaxID=936338 RepID=A0A8J3SIH8_9ACTN|nr:STAS domain-containing protein [Planobispora siamensis]GIH93055.1 hypothetical protein Psi01_36850 [Planobispora siamensis]